MATETIIDISVDTDKGLIKIKFICQLDDFQMSKLDFSLSIECGLNGVTTDIKADLANHKIETNIAVTDMLNDPLLRCLAGCIGGVVAGPIIECFNKDIHKYLKCLKSKGLAIAGKITECAIKCASNT